MHFMFFNHQPPIDHWLIMWKTRAYRISRNRRHSCQDQVCPHRAVSAMVHRIGSRRSEYGKKTLKKTRMLAVRNKWTWTSSTNLIYMIVCIILYVDMYVSLRALTFKTSTSEPGPNSCGLKPTGCQVVRMFLPHDVYNHLFHYCARVRVRMVISSVVRWC